MKEIAAHTATINDISFDGDGEYIGSCSDDGTVAINSLFTDEKLKFEYHRPMKAIALDPNYARNYRRFATGGLAGQVLVLTKKSWGGYHKKVSSVFFRIIDLMHLVTSNGYIISCSIVM